MRLAALTFIGALTLAAAVAPATAAPALPKADAQKASNLIQVWGGCGPAFHPDQWGYCVPNYYGGYGYGYGYPYYGGGYYHHWHHHWY